MKNPLFTSERLTFNTWKMEDLERFHTLNSDPKVMKHFPSVLTLDETKNFIERLIAHQKKHGYCYFSVELKKTKEWIGFIGLAYQNYDVPFLPCTDIGWRLKPSAWGKGYATEGAKRCLEFAFNSLGLTKLVATCTIQNTPSERVMKNIGMTRKEEFLHPRLKDYPQHERCIWYEIMG